jgi:hypothetical protein
MPLGATWWESAGVGSAAAARNSMRRPSRGEVDGTIMIPQSEGATISLNIRCR